MNTQGKIMECGGPKCPTPCCQKEVYLIPGEVVVIRGESEELFTESPAVLRKHPEKILLSHGRSFMSHCFDDGCKIEKNNPDFLPNKAQKGIACVLFPFFAINRDRYLGPLLRLSILPKEACPLVENGEAMRSHFYNSVLPVVKNRFPHVVKLEFDQSLARMLKENQTVYL